MKFTKTLLACAGILAMGTGMTSCLGSGNSDMEYTQTMSGFFNVAFTSPYDEPLYYNSVGYQIVFNSTQQTANVIIDGLKLPTATYSQLQFNDVKWSIPDYWKTINLTSVQPVSLTSTPVFDNFKVRILDRYVMNNIYAPLTQIQYNVMGLMINSIPSGVICVGTTSITPEGGSTTTTDEKSETVPVYALQLVQSTSANLNNESERKAVLQMANFSLDGAGLHSFVIKNIDWSINYSGTAKLSMSGDEPLQEATSSSSTTTTAYGDYVVTDFQGSADALNNMFLSFNVSSEKDNKKFTVVVSCRTPTTTSTAN